MRLVWGLVDGRIYIFFVSAADVVVVVDVRRNDENFSLVLCVAAAGAPSVAAASLRWLHSCGRETLPK